MINGVAAALLQMQRHAHPHHARPENDYISAGAHPARSPFATRPLGVIGVLLPSRPTFTQGAGLLGRGQAAFSSFHDDALSLTRVVVAFSLDALPAPLRPAHPAVSTDKTVALFPAS